MTNSATVGNLGIGKQSVKGTIATTFKYLPTTSISVGPMQSSQSLPMEIGGSHFVRGAYKTAVAVSGDTGFVVRADSFGRFLHMLCGQVASVANGGTPLVANPGAAPTPTTASTGGTIPAGTYTIAFTWVNANGETQASPTATQVTTGSTSTITVTVPALPGGATGWNLYISAVGVSSPLYKQTGSPFSGTSTTLTALTTTGSQPPAANSTGAPDGSSTHTFTPFAPAAGVDLPWYSLIKDVAKTWYESYVDVKLSGLRLDVSKQAIVTASTSFFGRTPAETTAPGVETFEDTALNAFFTSCQGSVVLTDEAGVITLPADASAPERISFDFGNALSQDEYVVGQYVPYDVTLLSRSAGVSYDLVVRSPDLHRAVYQNGGNTAWDPKLVRGALTVTLNSTRVIGTSTRPYSIVVTIPGMDLLQMPIQMSGGQLIRSNLSAQVSLGSSGTDTYTFNLTDDEAGY